jgi:hypothetical protein
MWRPRTAPTPRSCGHTSRTARSRSTRRSRRPTARTFYTERDRPEIEQLVHNLEHGYTILWYDDTIEGTELDTLKDLAESAANSDMAGPGNKFIVSAWDDSYGTFPSGKHVGLSHWGAQASSIQLCGKVSGDAVQAFMKKFPATDAPEPNAQ